MAFAIETFRDVSPRAGKAGKRGSSRVVTVGTVMIGTGVVAFSWVVATAFALQGVVGPYASGSPILQKSGPSLVARAASQPVGHQSLRLATLDPAGVNALALVKAHRSAIAAENGRARPELLRHCQERPRRTCTDRDRRCRPVFPCARKIGPPAACGRHRRLESGIGRRAGRNSRYLRYPHGKRRSRPRRSDQRTRIVSLGSCPPRGLPRRQAGACQRRADRCKLANSDAYAQPDDGSHGVSRRPACPDGHDRPDACHHARRDGPRAGTAPAGRRKACPSTAVSTREIVPQQRPADNDDGLPSSAAAMVEPDARRANVAVEQTFGLVMPTASGDSSGTSSADDMLMSSIPLPTMRPAPSPDAATTPAAKLTRPSKALLAYARPDDAGMDNEPVFKAPTSLPNARSRVAIYDISAARVYLPNGEQLEAHSGLGQMIDNPRYVNQKNRGPTPRTPTI